MFKRKRSRGCRTDVLLARSPEKACKCRVTYVCGDVELQVLVQIRDRRDLIVLQVKACDVQVLLQAVLRVALGDDGETALCRPTKENL